MIVETYQLSFAVFMCAIQAEISSCFRSKFPLSYFIFVLPSNHSGLSLISYRYDSQDAYTGGTNGKADYCNKSLGKSEL